MTVEIEKGELVTLIGTWVVRAAVLERELAQAKKDRDAYGEGLHALGAKVAGLQKTLLDAEHERDLLRGFELARTRMADATRPAGGVEALIAPHAAPCAVHRRVSVTADGDVWCAECSHLMRRTQTETREGTGAAPPAAVDPAQCVTVPGEAGAPTRTEPAGRSAPSEDLAAEHAASFPPADELTDEAIPFVPTEKIPPDPFLEGAPPAREEPKYEPWWRYAVGPPKGAYHLFVSAGSAEAECGETTDDETRPAPNLPPYEQTCMDCMDLAAQRGIKVPVCADEAPAVAEQPEPPEAADAEDPADEGAEPGRKYARKPRTCLVSGCDKPGRAAKNEFGAKTSGGLWCAEHAKALTAEERRDLHARDKKHRKEKKREAAAAKAGAAA